jgi:omega-6 fatty acid desaturase (delta-12 desaturase)
LIGLLFIAGHDACHNSFTASTRLNQVIGRLAFLPALHSFSLWDLAHNRTHHRYNNVQGWDYVWEPMTPAAYRASSRPRRLMYRLFRTPIGVALYYLMALWAPRMIVPFPRFVERITLVYLLDTLLVLAFLSVQLSLVVVVGAWFGKPPLVSVLFGFALPFLVWNAFMSFAIFLHHTHPAVRWYASTGAWAADHGAIRGTVHVHFAWPFEPMLLSIMQHNAHHLASGVPLYNLRRMQLAVEQRTSCIAWRFSWRGLARICRRCKLYDYDAQRWVGFEGQG